MELSNDLQIACSVYNQAGFVPRADMALHDWAGLYARLSAAHALRRELTRTEPGGSRPFGSFSDWPVPGCDGLFGKQPVNLKDSTDRKGPWGMKADSAGHVHAGDREL